MRIQGLPTPAFHLAKMILSLLPNTECRRPPPETGPTLPEIALHFTSPNAMFSMVIEACGPG